MIIGKVVPAHAVKAYRRSRGKAPLILILGTRFLDELSVSVGPRARLNVLEKRKISCSSQESNHGSSSP
jgi:hypothetical protein